jgi:hypothetical protein
MGCLAHSSSPYRAPALRVRLPLPPGNLLAKVSYYLSCNAQQVQSVKPNPNQTHISTIKGLKLSYSLSPGLNFRWASSARCVAVLAAYR